MAYFAGIEMLLAGALFVWVGLNGATDIQTGFGGLMIGNAFVIFLLAQIRDALERLKDGTVQPKSVAL